MRSVRDVSILFFVLFFSFSALALAEVEKGASRTIKLEAKPIDMTVTADGKYTFVLAEGGKVLIIDSNGNIKDTLKVSESAMSIGTSPDGNYLLLADSAANTLELIQISFIVDIDVSGLPFKGAADAPAVVAVFSDYQ
jgi:DNA-binding beta-propeller fold protein YncE